MWVSCIYLEFKGLLHSDTKTTMHTGLHTDTLKEQKFYKQLYQVNLIRI